MRTLIPRRSPAAASPSISRLRGVVPLIAVMLSLGGASFLGGCGSGGSGGPSPTPTAPASRFVTANFDVLWAAQTPTSASSISVTLRGAGVDNSDSTIFIDRTSNTAAYREQVRFPSPVRVGDGITMEVRLFTGASGTGALLRSTTTTISIRADGSGMGTISTASGITSVHILPNQFILIGGPTTLNIEARDADGTPISFSPEAAVITVAPADASRLRVVGGGQVQGLLPGTARVTVSLDGVVSPPENITVQSNAAVSINPGAVGLYVLEQYQFSAQVSNAPDSGITWSVREGIEGGTISQSGLYTAPARRGNFHVDAISVYDGTRSATATVTVHAFVSVGALSAAMTLGQQQTFAATVVGLADPAVLWSVQEGSSGGTVTANGVYTAPNLPGTYHLIATSREDATVQAVITITVQAGSGTVIIE